MINSAYGRQEDQEEADQEEADPVKTCPQEVNGSKEVDPQSEKKEGDEKAAYSQQGGSETASRKIARTEIKNRYQQDPCRQESHRRAEAIERQ